MLPTLTRNELTVLESLVPLRDARILEAGCGAARLARDLIDRYTNAHIVGLEIDERQLAKNLAEPSLERLQFVRAGAQAIPLGDAQFDGALMLKSLHHVPIDVMDQALAELRRVVRPQGWLYISEPVYAGELNELIRLFNDEGAVRAAAQAALDRAIQAGLWRQTTEHRFDMPVRFNSFEDFEQRMMRPTFADHHIDAAKLEHVRRHFEPSCGPDGANFMRPMHVRLLQRA